MGISQRRKDFWNTKYVERPYLRDAEENELLDRLSYILQNLTTLTDDQKIGFYPNREYSSYWMGLFMHIFAEYSRRGKGMPSIAHLKDVMPLPFYNMPIPTPKCLPQNGPFLAKYGKKQFLSDMLQYGKIRLSPASSFQDPSINNHAQRDNELTISLVALKSEIQMTHTSRATGVTAPITPIGNVHINKNFGSDFYVYCLSQRYEPRLFRDFNKDFPIDEHGCLVIHNAAEFQKRVYPATDVALRDFLKLDYPVEYIDPYNANNVDNYIPGFTKHHRFMYQMEYRFAWTPHEVRKTLSPIFIEVGSLADIAELITL